MPPPGERRGHVGERADSNSEEEGRHGCILKVDFEILIKGMGKVLCAIRLR